MSKNLTSYPSFSFQKNSHPRRVKGLSFLFHFYVLSGNCVWRLQYRIIASTSINCYMKMILMYWTQLHIYIYIYIHTHTHTHTHTYTHTCVCVCVCVWRKHSSINITRTMPALMPTRLSRLLVILKLRTKKIGPLLVTSYVKSRIIWGPYRVAIPR